MKALLKGVVRGVALLLVLPFAALELGLRAAFGKDVWFASQAEFFSLFPGKTGSYLRNAYYYLTLKECPFNLRLLIGTMFTHAEARVGQRVYFGAHCSIGTTRIGDDCMFADHVYVLSGRHQHGTAADTAMQDQPQQFEEVAIGRNVWIGTNTVVMADIGDDCIIGAGSVVTKPIPPNSVAVGNPARVIRSRSEAPAASPAR